MFQCEWIYLKDFAAILQKGGKFCSQEVDYKQYPPSEKGAKIYMSELFPLEMYP